MTSPRRTHRLLSRLAEPLRGLAFRSFSLAGVYTRTSLRLFPPSRPVLVYSMGKVGSSSLARSLESAAPNLDVFHLHWLVRENLDRDEALYRKASRSTRGTPAERRFRPGYIWAGRYFSTRIQESPRGGGKWVVVSAVRDPVARNVSSFFQNLRLFFDFDWHQRSRGEGQARAVGELRELFQSSFLNEEWLRMGMDSDPLTWLDTELRPALGIDVFREPFPTGRGYRIYSGTRARLLLFRLEDMDRCAGPAVEEFLGVRGFTLLPRNVASEKGYASLYRRFLDSLVLPDEYLDRMYGSRFSRHFYSEQELATFKNRWRRR